MFKLETSYPYGGKSMQILQTVEVKQILTENSKNALLDQYMEKKLQLEKESDQLHFEWKRLEKTKKFQTSELRNHFEAEIQKRREKERLLDFQIAQLHMLPIGSEVKEQEVQALIEVKAGDNWKELLKKPAIIVKDGLIMEIR